MLCNLEAIRQSLKSADAMICLGHVIGLQQNPHLSTKRDIRFGNKGSLVVHVADGIYYDHENAIGGDVFSLIQHITGCDFPQAIDIAASVAGVSDVNGDRSFPK